MLVLKKTKKKSLIEILDQISLRFLHKLIEYFKVVLFICIFKFPFIKDLFETKNTVSI